MSRKLVLLPSPGSIFDAVMEEKQKVGGEMVVFEGRREGGVEEEKQVKEYPAPLFTHKELCGDPGIFVEALRRFHSLMGSKFMIPVIGGKDLNLHLLYVEVTQRGGLEKKKDDTGDCGEEMERGYSDFQLSTDDNERFLCVEEVYFFGARGSLVPPAGGTCNFTVTGTIDGKFDYGYFVTVKIGSQLLHGILYHIHQHQIGSPPSVLNPDQPVSSPVNPVFQNPSTCSIAAATMVNANLSYMPATRSAGRRRRLKNRDPARPKPNRSAYNFFFAEKHFELKSQCPHMEREYSKRIGESWNKLTDQERLLYEDCARRDKERYRKEMQIYKERFKFLEPKQSEETARGIDLPKIVVRREMQDCSDRIEIARSKEMATLEKEARIAEDNKTEKQEITKREVEDYIQRVKFVNLEETASSAKSAKIEKLAHELGKEVINAAVEIDMMKTDSTVVNTEN
ncbi:hypothetical protein IEQ34_014795 [Dendrobium chrysotoxum]|uniref:HMG box domain-containing protein n=1 Tax=Dendrobium chrysotoxum TaxID=161865 RepID=A0AAV7GMZ5_DENCH|nr:hypothetical protein IEQ34_014795 [Dendrobium chrysotoxum]